MVQIEKHTNNRLTDFNCPLPFGASWQLCVCVFGCGVVLVCPVGFCYFWYCADDEAIGNENRFH